MIRHSLVALLVTVTLAGCGGQARTGVGVFYPTGQAAPPPDARPHVSMKYLGNGGWILRYVDNDGDDVIVTAPFFSNPRGGNVYFFGDAKPTVIDTKLGALDVDLQHLKVMLIGHGHYDHAMDLPHILKTKADGATLYGSKTVKHLLVKHVGTFPGGVERVKNVSGDAASGKTKGRWVVPEGQTSVRFMPLSSQHAPHLLGFLKVVWWGRLDEDQASLPMTPWGWPEGETLAYLIDFLRDGKPVFRIYYQDSAAPPGLGIVPDLDEEDRAPVDVAILCVAGSSQVRKNPRSILKNVKPRFVVGGHWEDFFTPFVGDEPQVAMGTSLEQFVRRAHKAANVPVFVPVPGETLRFPLRSP